jgi:transposase
MVPSEELSKQDLLAIIKQQSAAIDRLTDEVAQLRQMLFGQSRERIPTVKKSLRKRSEPTELEKAKAQVEAKATRKKRAAAKKKLPIEEIIHDIDQCPHCESRELKALGSREVSEETEYVPAHFVRKRHIRPKKKCGGCQKIVHAPAPERVADNCKYGPRFHAHVAVAKCADSLPLHRQAKQIERAGIPMTASSLGDIFHRGAELISPIARRILELIGQAQHVNGDETPIRIQAKDKCDRGYVWTFLSEEDKLIGYVFSASRSGETPRRILGETSGTLQADAYSGYNIVISPDKRERVSCLSHIRRDFFKALESGKGDAEKVLDLILDLYQVEYDAAAAGVLGTAKHLALRKEYTAAKLEELKAFLAEIKESHLPTGPMGKAIAYAQNHLDGLLPVLEDPKIRLDNNLGENALRIIAVGRKNFLFVGSEQAGENLAALQTVIATCNANDVNPEDYLADVLMRVGSTPASRIDELLPQNWAPQNS